MIDSELSGVNGPEVDFDVLWGRVEGVRNRINRLVPTPLRETDWQRLRASIKHLVEHYPPAQQPPDLEMCEKYVSAAKDDTRAAGLLDENGQIALTVYHLQQAAEKGMKSFCLAIGIANPESLRGTHRTPQPLLSILGSEFLGGMKRLFGGLAGKDYRKILRDVNRLVNNDPQLLARLSFTSTGRSLGIDRLLRTFDSLSHNQPVLEEKEDAVKGILAECLPEYRGLIMAFSGAKYGEACVQCFILGALTFPHESPTRYPGGFLEPQNYDGCLGIVQAIPALRKRTPLLIANVEGVVGLIRTRRSSD